MDRTSSTSRQGGFREGDDVYGADGEKVGSVVAVQPNYVVVEKGLFSPTDYYIPTGAVAAYDDGKIYLNVTKDQALTQGWDAEPVTERSATTDATRSPAMPMATGATEVTADTAATDAEWGGMADDVGASMEHRQDSDRTHENTAEGLTLRLHEEELTASKRTRDIGEVRIETDVVSEQSTVEVPLTEERVRVERRAVDRPLAAGETAFDGATIDVPVMGEEVQLEKRVRVAEEVEVGTEAVQRTERVGGTVRREEVRLTETGETGGIGVADGSDRMRSPTR